MLERAQKILFLFIVFFLSSQVGLHFWPEFSYVNGIRVDYLSPTLYFLDILIVGWIMVSLKLKIEKKKEKSVGLDSPVTLLVLLLVLDLVWNLFAAKSVGAHLLGLVKLSEFGLFGWLVAKSFKPTWIPDFVRMLSTSAIVSSSLAIWQFVIKSSVGGAWYFFGERTFTISTVGISSVNLDQQILRPYGAFPHPNVLAFFLFMSVVFSVENFKYEKKWWKLVLLASSIVSSVAIILTFSRIAIFLLALFIIYEIFIKLSRKLAFGVLGFLQIVIPFFLIFILDKYFTFIARGIDFRQELMLQSFEIYKANSYFGIGLNNFFVNQAPLIHTLSPVNLQPPHNMFIVSLLSLGFFGFLIFPYLIYLAIRNLIKRIRRTNSEIQSLYISILIVLIGVVISGIFDHFFVTLEQGQIILTLVLGLAFSNMSFPKFLKKRKSKRRK